MWAYARMYHYALPTFWSRLAKYYYRVPKAWTWIQEIRVCLLFSLFFVLTVWKNRAWTYDAFARRLLFFGLLLVFVEFLFSVLWLPRFCSVPVVKKLPPLLAILDILQDQLDLYSVSFYNICSLLLSFFSPDRNRLNPLCSYVLCNASSVWYSWGFLRIDFVPSSSPPSLVLDSIQDVRIPCGYIEELVKCGCSLTPAQFNEWAHRVRSFHVNSHRLDLVNTMRSFGYEIAGYF